MIRMLTTICLILVSIALACMPQALMTKDSLHSQVRQGHGQMVKYMLNSGANPNAIDDRGNYPITYAIANNDFALVKVLIEAGANPNAKGKDLLTPIHACCVFGRGEILKYLKDRDGDIYALTNGGESCLLLSFVGQLDFYKSDAEKFKAARYETIDEVESRYAQVVQFLMENKVRMKKDVFKKKCPDCNLQSIQTYKFPMQAERVIKSINESMFSN